MSSDKQPDLNYEDEEYFKEIEDARFRIYSAADEEFKKAKIIAIQRAIARATARKLGSLKGGSIAAEFDLGLNLPSTPPPVPQSPPPVINSSSIKAPDLVQVVKKELLLPKSQPIAPPVQVQVQSSGKPSLVIYDLDNIVLDNCDRKMNTYLEIGWDRDSINDFISKKENIYGKIASFNTTRVTFTASSRRNRYYEIFNRPDMLEFDKPYPGVIEAINKLSKDYDIYIVSERTQDLEQKTLEVMKKLGFPMEKIKIYFKKTHEVLRSYKNATVVNIKTMHPSGAAIVIQPEDGTYFERIEYTPIGFTSIAESMEFQGQVKAICNNWQDVIALFNQN